ncbi:Na+/H+ antiporter subunit E [Ectothiorhodospiraceae bacterium BW-2]|nr:Na+/H+ antiporter subunit E [Ectothiorhodospiraceae bacterium BW-2]
MDRAVESSPPPSQQERRRLLPHPILSLLLLLVWLLLNNTVAPGHVVLGSLLAIVIPFFTSSFWDEPVHFRHFTVFIRFIALVMVDIVVANIIVAKQVLSPNHHLKPALFQVPLDIRDPVGISVLASTISLTPGTVSCDLSEDQRFLIVHGLSVDSVEEEVALIKQRYERSLMEIFDPC